MELKVNVYKNDVLEMVIVLDKRIDENGWYVLVQNPGAKYPYKIPLQRPSVNIGPIPLEGYRASLTDLIGPILDDKYWFERLGVDKSNWTEEEIKANKESLDKITPKNYAPQLQLLAEMDIAESC